jgi:hypothetical protein
VIAPVVNPVRFRSRWRLYEDFEKHCADAGAICITIECALGGRDWAVTRKDNPHHVQVRTDHELFLKECLTNAAVRFLPHDAKYIAMVDADMTFVRPDWANETVQQLQHYDVVQMWSQIQDVDLNFESRWSNVSFLYNRLFPQAARHAAKQHGYPYPQAWPPRGAFGSPGGAWAWRRSAWDTVGGMLDCAILGSGDLYMAHGLFGTVGEWVNGKGFHPAYVRRVMEWQERAKALHQNVGMVQGLMLHHWHGPRRNRGYDTRNQILIRNQFNPDLHLWHDGYGVHRLRPDAIRLRDEIREYFRARNEDATC